MWSMQHANRESVPAHMTMMFGAIAAVASSSASFPLEIVRRRAMMGTLPAGSGPHPVFDQHAHPDSLYPHSRHVSSQVEAEEQPQGSVCFEHAQAYAVDLKRLPGARSRCDDPAGSGAAGQAAAVLMVTIVAQGLCLPWSRLRSGRA